MSCSICGTTTNCNCDSGCNRVDPCVVVQNQQESVASMLNNLIAALLGEVTKTYSNGVAVWSTPCSPDDTGIYCVARGADEGLICYLLRILKSYGMLFGGNWDVAATYCNNTFVMYGGSAYVSIQSVPAGILPTNTTYWQIAVASVAGPAGPQGPPGPPGPSTTPTYPIRTIGSSITAANTDGCIFVASAAAPVVVTLPAIGTLDAGKWFRIWTDGSQTVTLTANAADNIQGAASYAMTVANESVLLVSDGANTWRVL